MSDTIELSKLIELLGSISMADVSSTNLTLKCQSAKRLFVVILQTNGFCGKIFLSNLFKLYTTMAFRARSHHHLRIEPENKLNSNACVEAYM